MPAKLTDDDFRDFPLRPGIINNIVVRRRRHALQTSVTSMIGACGNFIFYEASSRGVPTVGINHSRRATFGGRRIPPNSVVKML